MVSSDPFGISIKELSDSDDVEVCVLTPILVTLEFGFEYSGRDSSVAGCLGVVRSSYMCARNHSRSRLIRRGGADRGSGSGSCQDPGRGSGHVRSPGRVVDRDLEERLSASTILCLGLVRLLDASCPRRREESDVLTAVASDRVEVERSNSVLPPRLGLLALAFVCSGWGKSMADCLGVVSSSGSSTLELGSEEGNGF